MDQKHTLSFGAFLVGLLSDSKAGSRFPLFEQSSNLSDAFSIRTHIPISETRSRTHVNLTFAGCKQKLDIVHKLEEFRGELGSEIASLFDNHPRLRHPYLRPDEL